MRLFESHAVSMELNRAVIEMQVAALLDNSEKSWVVRLRCGPASTRKQHRSQVATSPA